MALVVGLIGAVGAPPAAHGAVSVGNEIIQVGSIQCPSSADAIGAQWKDVDAGGTIPPRSAPECYTLALKRDGTVWAWGNNNFGQLGNGTLTTSSTPVQVVGPGGVGVLSGITAISAGGRHALALRNDGTVWAWGFNLSGQLGNLSTTDSSTPVEVVGPGELFPHLTGITAISAGGSHSLARKSDGTVWAWGSNSYGELGNNTTNIAGTNFPVQVAGLGGTGVLTGITAISAGGYFSLARRSDGTAWAWGYGLNGQLGNNTTTSSSTPVQVVGPGGIGPLTGITAVSAGGSHALARRSDGTVWAWGYNYYSQLGDNTTTNSSVPTQVLGAGGTGVLRGVTSISAGGYYSLARKGDGTVWGWGYNFDRQLGAWNGAATAPTPIMMINPATGAPLTTAVAVSAGGAHSAVLSVPTLSTNPSLVNFGTIRTNASATSGPITITNVDSTSVTVLGVTTAGPDSGAFDVNGPSLPISVAPGNSFTLPSIVATTDATARTYSASIVVTTDRVEPLVVPIALRAVDPAWALGPTSLTFPPTAVGYESPTLTANVANSGLVPITVTGVGITDTNSSSFSIAFSTCSGPVAPATTCSIFIRARPIAAGPLSATLVVTTDAGSKTIALLGSAKNPADLNVAAPPTTTTTAGTGIATVVTITNFGPNTAKGIQVVLDAGPGGTITAATGTGYTCWANTVSQRLCTRPGIINGATTTITVTANWTAGVHTITATLSTTGTIDPDPSDNTAARNVTNT